MSVTTRTNLATNPAATSTTNYAAVAGTGGTAAISNQTGTGAFGPNFNQVTWSVATTAVSGGGTYTQTGLAAATQYSHQVWVQSSKTQTVALTAQYRNSPHTNVGTAASSGAVALIANVWTEITVTSTSGAAVTEVVLSVAATTGGVNWANGDTLGLDAVCIETGPTAGPYFDGGLTNAGSTVFAWVGTANASKSTAVLYAPYLTLAPASTAPCPRVVITINDLAPTPSIVNVWRTADGLRQSVRGARGRTVTGSDAVTDYETPLGRPVAYDLEILTGVSAQAPVTTTTTTITSTTWWIQDPLVPSSAIALATNQSQGSALTLTAAAVKTLEYSSGMSIIPILGSSRPVALMGDRQAASNLDMSMFTRTATATTTLRNLIQQTPLLLIRSNGVRNDGVPGLAYYASATPAEQPVTAAFGGTLTHWALTGALVSAPTMNVIVPIWTYGTVAALWTTYQQAQTTLASKKYLDVLKSPSGV